VLHGGGLPLRLIHQPASASIPSGSFLGVACAQRNTFGLWKRGNEVIGYWDVRSFELYPISPIPHHPARTITDELCRPNNPREQSLRTTSPRSNRKVRLAGAGPQGSPGIRNVE
jgi:hypothetical protein